MARSDYEQAQKLKLINSIVTNRVNFVSGTICPASSNKLIEKERWEPSDIEPIDVGLSFLFNMYDKKLNVSIQPKFMGSRINMYLFADDTEARSYCVSRNGYYVKNLSREQLSPLYTKMRARLNKFIVDNNASLIILDGELLPWSALGTGLISGEFLPVDIGLETELEHMEQYGWDAQLAILKDRINKIDPENKSKENVELEKVKELANELDTKETRKLYEIYHKQMCLYAGDMMGPIKNQQEIAINLTQVVENINESVEKEEYKDANGNKLEYKAFGILKICKNDGTESVPLDDKTIGQIAMYSLVSDPDCASDDQLVLELNEANFLDKLEIAREWFSKLTMGKGFEGIIIKPDLVSDGKLHMIKCRNPEYLTIIYGYDYTNQAKLSRLIKNKSTTGKIKQSIKEYKQGIRMLKTPYNTISHDNKEYMDLLSRFMYNEEFGKTLDPRL